MNFPDFKTLPQAIAIDLDGTLLNSHTELSVRSRLALQGCIDHGIPVIIATSRPVRIFQRIFPPQLTTRCSLIAMNGALAVAAPPLTGRFKFPLDPVLGNELIARLLSLDPEVRITVEIDGYIFGCNWTADREQLWQRNAATPEMVCSIAAALQQQPCKIAASGKDIDRLAVELASLYAGRLSIVSAKSGTPLLNITGITASKSNSLRRILTPAGIALRHVLAFGDDLPDKDMLLSCGIPVAMENALPEIKNICRYETAANDADGVALVLEKLLTAL